MCRLLGYRGPSIPMGNLIVCPEHSLLAQSQHATEAKLATNADGFGVAWYVDGVGPGLYRDVLPAWSDTNLPSLCRMVSSTLFLAHVRASTEGETTRVNCHPFVHDGWSFCHNGQIAQFETLRRALEAELPDDLYQARRGTTDSEAIFLWLLAHGLQQDPMAAIDALLARLAAVGPVRLTCVFTDGDTLWAFRQSSKGPAPTLYLSPVAPDGSRTVASEPLTAKSEGWTEVPEDQLIRLDARGSSCLPLKPARAKPHLPAEIA